MSNVNIRTLVTPPGSSVSIIRQIDKEELALLSKLDPIHISISDCKLTKELVDWISLSSIVAIEVARVDDEVNGLASILNLQSIRKVTLRDQVCPAGTLTAISRRAKLISVIGTQVLWSELKELANNPHLLEFSLSLTSIIDDCETSRCNFDSVEILDLSGAKLGEQMLDRLNFSTNLRVANLMFTDLKQDAVDRFQSRHAGAQIWFEAEKVQEVLGLDDRDVE